MNSKINVVATASKSRWWPASWLLPLVSLPPLLGLAVVVWLSYRELRAVQQLQPLRASLRWEEGTAAETGPEEVFQQTTSTETTAQWSRIYFLLSTEDVNSPEQLPIVGNAPLPFLLDPTQPWEAESRVEKYLSHLQPVLELIHQAAAAPEPVWQPIAFNGYATRLPHLQAARGPARLLQLQAELALYRGDQAQALAAIAALQGTARSIDWDIFMVARLVQSSVQDIHLRTIQRSLHTNIWNAQQLEQLMSQVDQPIAIEETFPKDVRSELAMANSILESDSDFFPGMRAVKFPSAKLEVLRHYSDLAAVASQGTGRLSTRVRSYEDKWQDMRGGSAALAGQLMPSFTAYAISIEMSEQLRQLTLVGLALKLFQLENQRWPQELAELLQVGLSPADWTIKGLGPMGYSAEGQRAYVWGVKRDEASIVPRRPAWDDEEFAEVYHLVVVSK